MNRSRWHPSRWGLGTRFVVVFLALLLLMQAVVFVVVGQRIGANARASVAGELELGERALLSLLGQRAERLAVSVGVLARDEAFRKAYEYLVTDGDTATLQSALESQVVRAGARLAAFVDNEHRIRVSTSPVTPHLAAAVARVVPKWPRERGPAGSIADPAPLWTEVVDGQPLLFVPSRFRAPIDHGWVLMGFALDDQLARDLRNITGLDLVLLAREGGGRFEPTVDRLPAAVSADLRALDAGSLASRGSVLLGGIEYGKRAIELGPDLRAVLLRSVDEAAAPYRALQWPLAQVTLAGLLAFGLAAALTARRITHPVRRLVAAAQRLGGGDLATPVRGTGRADEIGELAQAFEAMRCGLAEQQTQLERLAYWDTLTGLPNRVRFGAALRNAIAAADPATDRLAVLILDLDHFKHVNDVLGHAGGDRLLQGVAQRLQEAVTAGETLARLSGDEFALLLPGCGPERAFGMAQRVAALLEVPQQIDDQTIDTPPSIGIAVWPLDAADPSTLLSRAEIAMVVAKARKSGPMLYDPATDSSSVQTLSLRSELKRAVEQGELRLYLQPKIGLRDGALIGAEALVRWQHPQRGMVPPMQFIPFAERTGVIRQLTLWVFEAAARESERLAALAGGPLKIAVNLSARDLLDAHLPETLGHLLTRHDARADGFCLEVTEGAIMDDPARGEATLRRLAERGFRLSIDDFGTGQSSLAYLQRLPVNELKIDKSFVLGMNDRGSDAAIVRSAIDLAHNLGLGVVAEGVEDAAIFNALRRLGCDEAQGYHLSRPMPAEAFGPWAQRWNARAATGWGGLELA